MSKDDLYVQTVEAIYAGGVESERRFDAPEAISRPRGGRGASLEVIDQATQRHIEFASAALASVARDKYRAHDAAIIPRIPPVLRRRTGEVSLMQRLCPHFRRT
jgi:hypothetical protein